MKLISKYIYIYVCAYICRVEKINLGLTLSHCSYLVMGTLKGFDPLVNLVLDNCTEFLRGMVGKRNRKQDYICIYK